jgi:predicted alpha/beta-hydrolase family hydrolase
MTACCHDPRLGCEDRCVPDATVLELDTPHGLARAHLHSPAGTAVAALVLGHGAGGSITAPDLQAVAQAALGAELTVALVEQPYRVAGRRSAAPAHQLDASWIAVVEQLRAGSGKLAGLPLVAGGRSSGARVACRTAAAVGAAGVLCLAFPLVPPARVGAEPRPSRLPELDALDIPTLVVQGESDRFGMPPPGPSRSVVRVRGDHSLRGDREAVADAVRAWLPGVLGG